MANFNPSQDVFEKWTATRKAKKALGDSFYHPRIFSTVSYAKDAIMFWIAMAIEAATLFVAVFYSGFDPFLIIGAIVLVALDLWFGGNRLHLNDSHINKLNCKWELSKYEDRHGLKTRSSAREEQEGFRRSIAVYERRKIKFKIAILLIAAIKAFFGFLVLAPYGMVVAVGVPALFFIAAYIHIENTGYFLSEWRRRRAFSKEESRFIGAVATNDRSEYEVYAASLRPLESLSIFKNEKEELEAVLTTLSAQEKEARRVNEKNKNIDSGKFTVLFGENSNHKIVYDEDRKSFHLYRWGNIQDDDLFNLIGTASMSPQLKSYVGYNALKCQYGDTNIEEPKIPVN